MRHRTNGQLKERQARLQEDTGQEYLLTWGRSHSRNIKLEITMNLWGPSGNYYENLKFLGAIVRRFPLSYKLFSGNSRRLSQGKCIRTWKKSSPVVLSGLLVLSVLAPLLTKVFIGKGRILSESTGVIWLALCKGKSTQPQLPCVTQGRKKSLIYRRENLKGGESEYQRIPAAGRQEEQAGVKKLYP